MKEKGSGFSCPIHPEAAAALTAYIGRKCFGLPPGAPLFRSSKSLATALPLHAWRSLKQAHQSAALRGKVACHSTRTIYTKKIYAALGHDLVATQAAMHHASISSKIEY